MSLRNARCNDKDINPLNAELNPICHLLALLGAHHIFHVSGLRANQLSFATETLCFVRASNYIFLILHRRVFAFEFLNVRSRTFTLRHVRSNSAPSI